MINNIVCLLVLVAVFFVDIQLQSNKTSISTTKIGLESKVELDNLRLVLDKCQKNITLETNKNTYLSFKCQDITVDSFFTERSGQLINIATDKDGVLVLPNSKELRTELIRLVKSKKS